MKLGGRRRARRRCAIVGALYMTGESTPLEIAETTRLSAGAIYPDLAYLERQQVIDYLNGRYRLKPAVDFKGHADKPDDGRQRTMYEHLAEPVRKPSWTCEYCQQVNSGWATECGRCERPRELQ